MVFQSIRQMGTNGHFVGRWDPKNIIKRLCTLEIHLVAGGFPQSDASSIGAYAMASWWCADRVPNHACNFQYSHEASNGAPQAGDEWLDFLPDRLAEAACMKNPTEDTIIRVDGYI
jgi:hypothetical protein